MSPSDEAPGIHLVKATIPDFLVGGEPVSTFFVTACGTPEMALEEVRKVAPADWLLEVSDNRLSVATVRRLGLRLNEVRRF